MIEKIKKIKKSKILKVIGNVLYALIFILVILMLLVVILQRATNNNMTIGGFRIFSVETGSMIPVYEIGDILVSKQIKPENIEVGDDIVYQGKEGSYNGKVVTHRVKSIEKEEDGSYKIITQGVANNIQDPEINQSQVFGKIICNMKILKIIGKLVRNVYAFYVLLFIPVIILVVRNIKGIIVMNKEQTNEEDSDENE